jgi:uncharacterized membrane protein YqjE
MNPHPEAAPPGTGAQGDAPGLADPAASRGEPEIHPAREMSLHLLRMFETRMDAAAIALQGEGQRLMARLQLKLFAAAALFIAIWGGIVLLAIALPPHLRVPVLSGVVAGFVVIAVVAQWIARRKAATQDVGSLHWFLESLRKDLEVLSRALARSQQPARQPTSRSASHDLAA